MCSGHWLHCWVSTSLVSVLFYNVSLQHVDEFQIRHQFVMFSSKNRAMASSVLPFRFYFLFTPQSAEFPDCHKSDYKNKILCLERKSGFVLESSGRGSFDWLASFLREFQCPLCHQSYATHYMWDCWTPELLITFWVSVIPKMQGSKALLGTVSGVTSTSEHYNLDVICCLRAQVLGAWSQCDNVGEMELSRGKV